MWRSDTTGRKAAKSLENTAARSARGVFNVALFLNTFKLKDDFKQMKVSECKKFNTLDSRKTRFLR